MIFSKGVRELDETMKHLLQIIDNLDKQNNRYGASKEDTFSNAQSEGIEFSEILDTLEKMKDEGIIYECREDFFKTLGPLKDLFKKFDQKLDENGIEEPRKQNFKYANGSLHFTIQDHIKALLDVEDVPEIHSDGKDRMFSKPIEIKTTLFSYKNFSYKRNYVCNSAGTVIFYRENHKELLNENGSYIIVIYSFFDGIINIHGIKEISAKDIDHLIQKSKSKKKIGIRWTRFFKKVSDIPLFTISDRTDIVTFRNQQLKWLRILQDFSISSVKVSKEVGGGPSKWTLLNEAAFPVDHRTILLRELVFDLDFKKWTEIMQCGNKLIAELKEMKIPHFLAHTGGRGLHIHVFFELPQQNQEKWPDANFDPKDLRIWLFHYILREAGIKENLIGPRKPFDTSCINWDDFSKGHLIRIFGGKKRSFKTLISEIPEERPIVTYDSVVFPEEITAWEIPDEIFSKFIGGIC